jgi:hypothetical protein
MSSSPNLPNWLQGEEVATRQVPATPERVAYVASPQQSIVITDVKIPFLSMVVLILKFTFASIPAMIVVALLNALVLAAIGAAFMAMGGVGRVLGN